MRDRDVREAVLAKLAAEHASEPDTRVLQEMGVWSGVARIDIAIVNGELCGYELKSDRDTLERLPRQIEYYGKVFDRVTIVAGARHASKVAAMVPSWWGIEMATASTNSVAIDSIRVPATNPGREPYLIAELLSKTEALEALHIYGLAAGWRSKPIKDIHLRLTREIAFDDLRALVRVALKRRDYTLRNNRSGEFNVSIHRETNPMFKVCRTN